MKTTSDEGSTANLGLMYRLQGDFTDGIDAVSLGPILLGISTLVRTSNDTIHATEKEITVQVKPFREGSFLIDLALQAKVGMEAALFSVNHDDITKLKTLLECIGLICGGVAGGAAGLLKLLKFLKGRPKDVQKVSPDQIVYTNQNGDKLTVSGPVHALFQNCTVLGTIDEAITKPLKLAQVTGLDTYLPQQERETKVQLVKEDAQCLESAVNSQGIATAKAGAQDESHQIVWVSPKTGNYEGEPTSWSFRKIGDRTAFRAKLTDAHFLERLKAGEVRLSGRDALRVELVEIQDLQEGRMSRSIVKVLEYRPAPRQTTLDPKVEGPSYY